MDKTGKLRYRIASTWLFGHRAATVFRRQRKGILRILLFHDIAPAEKGAFGRLVDYVVRRHPIVTPDEWRDPVRGHQEEDRNDVPVLFTFDDGYSSQGAVAREVLDAHGIKGVFFVCPGLVGRNAGQRRQAVQGYLKDGQVASWVVGSEVALMDWDELGDLAERGHTIGSHTLCHLRLSRVSSERKAEEIETSADVLETRLGMSVRWFAYPFGDVRSIDEETVKLVRARYLWAASGVRGVNRLGTHPLGLFREPVDLSAPWSYQQLEVEGALDFRWRVARTRLARLLQ